MRGAIPAREFYEGILHVPSDWGTGDPSSWSGEVEVLAYGPASVCSGGRQPVATIRIPLTGHALTDATLAGNWYRLACTCTPAYGPILDDSIRVCNANTLLAGFRTRCSQRATALNGPFSTAYTATYAGYSVDPDHSACNPIPENWSLISSRPRTP